MKKIKCTSKLKREELEKITKYGNYAWSKANLSYIWTLIFSILATSFSQEFEIIFIILAAVYFILLTFKFSGINLQIKKQNRVLEFPISVNIEFKEDGFIYTRSITKKNESIELSYNNVAYIMEIEDFIILSIDTLNNYTQIIAIKKSDINIDNDEFKDFIFNKCRKLEKFKITNPRHMHIILRICQVLYIIFFLDYLCF